MAGDNGRGNKSLQAAAVILVLCALVQTLTCFSLQQLSKNVEQDEVFSGATVMEVRKGSIFFNGKVFNSKSGSASAPATGNDGLLHIDSKPSHGRGVLEQTSELRDNMVEAAWRHLNISLHCGQSKMKLKAMGPRAAELQLDMGNANPLPLIQVPKTCGYSMRQNALGLVLVVPYDGCNVIRENGEYMLPMRWLETPVNFTCHMLRSSATTTQKPARQPWRLPFPLKPWSLNRPKRHITQPNYDPNLYYYLYYYYMNMMTPAPGAATTTAATTTKPETTAVTNKPLIIPPAYPYYYYNPYLYYSPNFPVTTTTATPTTVTSGTTPTTTTPTTTTPTTTTPTTTTPTTTTPTTTTPTTTTTTTTTTTSTPTTRTPQMPPNPYYPYLTYPFYPQAAQQMPGFPNNPYYYYPYIQQFYGNPPYPTNAPTITTKPGNNAPTTAPPPPTTTAPPPPTTTTPPPTTTAPPPTATAPPPTATAPPPTATATPTTATATPTTTTTATPTTTTTAPTTTTKCAHTVTSKPSSNYPGQMSPYVPYYQVPFTPYVSYDKAGKLSDDQKYMPQAGYKSGLQAQAHPGFNNWQPVPWFPDSMGKDTQFAWNLPKTS